MPSLTHGQRSLVGVLFSCCNHDSRALCWRLRSSTNYCHYWQWREACRTQDLSTSYSPDPLGSFEPWPDIQSHSEALKWIDPNQRGLSSYRGKLSQCVQEPVIGFSRCSSGVLFWPALPGIWQLAP